MDMKDLAEMLEEELSEAVEVKDPKSLHRYISLLTGNYVEQNIHERQYNELTGSIKEILTSMKEGFRRVDERFAAQDNRFEAQQKQMDERFTALQKQIDERFSAQERQFDRQHKLISLGFTAMVLVIAAFNLTVILS
ncbi:MAG: hypothetical protein U5P10_12870 [Spirochaetia bacterium]|nr:hypothetical protein [Spirochaetia bacterium]